MLLFTVQFEILNQAYYEPFSIKMKQAINQHQEYAVWMFPFSPVDDVLMPPSKLICAYSNACNGLGYEKVNLRELTERMYFQNYIRDHAYHKFRHRIDFIYHIQAITMIALLKRDDSKGIRSCVTTLGSTLGKFCTDQLELFSSYNPYAENLSSANYPFSFLNHDGNDSHDLSLAPRELLRSETFAVAGPPDEAYDVVQRGQFNSGEDVQVYAAAGWMPFLNEVRDKQNAFQNFTGHYISNGCYGGMSFNVTEKDYEGIDKLSLLSVYFSKEGIEPAEQFLKKYTEEVHPFGCRSTSTDQIFKSKRIKSYFSACLTLTINIEGALTAGPDTPRQWIKRDIVRSPNGTRVQNKKYIIAVDVIDKGAVPAEVWKNPNLIEFTANIPRWYAGDAKSLIQRYEYSYKLLSAYANQAKLVITSRIHAALPATALGIPVVFVHDSRPGKTWLPGGKEGVGRVEGLLDIFHEVDKKHNKNWTLGDISDDSKDIPFSIGVHKADRYRASFWNRLKKTHYYEDTARMIGFVPFKRIGVNVQNKDSIGRFHFILTKADLTWHTRRAIEHVFFYHPNAVVYVHSSDITIKDLEIFHETGYDLKIVPFDTKSLSNIDVSSLVDKSPTIAPFLLLKTPAEGGGVFVSKNTMIIQEIQEIVEGMILNENEEIAMAFFHASSSQQQFESVVEQLNRKFDVDSHRPAWNVPVLSNKETVKCKNEIGYSVPGYDEAIAISLHEDALYSELPIKFHWVCFEIVEKICIFCDELYWEY